MKSPQANESRWTAKPGPAASKLPKVVVIGCSGHARVVIDIIEKENKYSIVGLLDTYKPVGTELHGYRVMGNDDDLAALMASHACEGVIVAIGDNWIRSRMVARVRQLVPGIRFIRAVHPSAQVADDVSIGQGTVVMPGVVVNTGSQLGEFCILNTASVLDHESSMEEYSSLAPRAVTGGGVRIGAFSAVAIGAVISHSIRIGKHVVVGAGATVLQNVPDRVVSYGTPARVVRSRQPGDSYLGDASSHAIPSQPTQGPAVLSSLDSVKLVATSSPEWDATLEPTAHDFYHTAKYHEVSARFGSGTAWLAIYGSEDKFVAWPYLLRDVESPDKAAEKMRDVTSVYGYPGPLVHNCQGDEEFLTRSWEAVVEAWRAQGAISAFTRFHPILDNVQAVSSLLPSPELNVKGGPFAQGRTVVIDLLKAEAEIWQGYKRNVRSALRRCERAGLVTESDPDWRYLDDFVRLYYKTMQRNQAVSFYFFSKDYFSELRLALGDRGSLMITKQGEEVIAGGLLMECNGIVNLHLLAADDRFGNLSPSKLVIHQSQLWARGRGNRMLHLGGGRGSRNDDPLFRFKTLFSEDCYPFYTGRWILDQAAYDFLSRERQRENEKLTHSYFPTYRAPFPNIAPSENLYADPSANDTPQANSAA